MCVLGLSEPVDSVLMFPGGYDTLEYSWVKATAVLVCLRILFVTLQNTNIAAEDGVVGVVVSTTSKVIASVLWVLPSPNVTFNSILLRASILLPSKPMCGYYDFCRAFSVSPILTKHCQTRMFAELPLSTRIRPTSFPAKCTEFFPMFALLTRGSLCG